MLVKVFLQSENISVAKMHGATIKKIIYTHFTGGWVDPRAGKDDCPKSRPHRDSIAGSSSTLLVAVTNELSRSTILDS